MRAFSIKQPPNQDDVPVEPTTVSTDDVFHEYEVSWSQWMTRGHRERGCADHPLFALTPPRSSSTLEQKQQPPSRVLRPSHTPCALHNACILHVPHSNASTAAQFGGPTGVLAMMLGFPPLMYYLWACLVFFDGKLVGPKSFSLDDIKGFVTVFAELAANVSVETPSARWRGKGPTRLLRQA